MDFHQRRAAAPLIGTFGLNSEYEKKIDRALFPEWNFTWHESKLVELQCKYQIPNKKPKKTSLKY